MFHLFRRSIDVITPTNFEYMTVQDRSVCKQVPDFTSHIFPPPLYMDDRTRIILGYLVKCDVPHHITPSVMNLLYNDASQFQNCQTHKHRTLC